jgi:hypothetical protein
MSGKYERVVRELRRYSSDGYGVVDVVRQLHFGWRRFKAEMSLPIHSQFVFSGHSILTWVTPLALGWGGDMSDEELEQLLGRLVPRSSSIVDPQERILARLASFPRTGGWSRSQLSSSVSRYSRSCSLAANFSVFGRRAIDSAFH